jgi:hypothetical protein
MKNQVELGLVLSSSHPSGTGSFAYEGSFKIVIQNLAFQKQVSVWVQVGPVWKDILASYSHSLPENNEVWIAPASNSEGEFVAKYTVNGTTYWDNNGGMNYKFPQAFDEFAVLSGKKFPVVLGNASLFSNNLHINLGIQNLDFAKVVGIVFTPDNWITVQTAFAHWDHNMPSGLEVWTVDVPVGSATQIQFAAFYRVHGNEFWDNNFSSNYKVTPTSPQQWGGVA